MATKRMALAALLFGCALAEAANVEERLTISGEVYATPPCIINENRPINVPFGDVVIASIDGVYKTTSLVYSWTCKEAPGLRIKFSGNYSTNIWPLLEVPEKDNLGIQIKVDDNPIEINTWLKINNFRQPRLEAVLVKKKGGKIKPGPFRSSATLEIDYP